MEELFLKIVQINSFSYGSTGKIMMSIHNELINHGYESWVIWGRGRKSNNIKEIFMNDICGVYFHVLYSRLTGKTGFASRKSTIKLIERLDEIKPDIIHLHNIHGYYINIELLFKYIKQKNIKLIWTLHDCWGFTGQCPHFTLKKCSKWKKQCQNCPMIKEYPKALIDNSFWNYNMKKKLFTNLNATIITPSKWLSNLVKESFLKEYDIITINNGIDINVFKPTKSDFRKKHSLEDKKIILGVASIWDTRKGLNDFVRLSKVLDDSYRIVLVGVSKKQIKSLPNNIIGIRRTSNQKELAEIYSAADVFLNTTYEDNYPTVNLEAIACGTPVLSYDTGGSVEFINFIKNKNDNYIINKKDIKRDINILKEYIDRIIGKKMYLIDPFQLSEKTMIKKYIKIYQNVSDKEY